jgi:hypothetical protein
MAKKKTDVAQSLSQRELRELFEFLKVYAPLSPEQAAEFIKKLGGFKKMTLDLFEAIKQKGDARLAARLLRDLERRSHSSNPELAREATEVLALLKHEA